MKNDNFHRTITVDAPAEEVMKNISQIQLWWVKNFSDTAEKLGDKFHVPMGSTFIDCQVSELVPGKKVAWKVTGSHIPWLKDKHEWTGTEIVFELTADGHTTRIDFTHIGLSPEVECYETCEKGWDRHIVHSLLPLINEGKGNPKEF